jgi:hypothetical protein
MARRHAARMTAARVSASHGAAALAPGKKGRRQQTAQAKLHKRFHQIPQFEHSAKEDA